MSKRTLCYGTGALVVVAGAVGGTFAVRHFAGRSPGPAVAASSLQTAPAMNTKVNSILDLVRQERAAVAPAATQPTAASPATAPAATQPATAAPRPAAAQPTRSVAPVAPARPVPADKLTHDERVLLDVATQLQTLRSTIELWKLRHEGRSPDFGKFPMWQQFTQRDAAGQGLQEVPVNPLNGVSRVLPVQGDIKAGLTIKGGSFGYVYSLTSGKLWATDENGAIFNDAAIDTLALRSRAVRELTPKQAERSVASVLNTLRAQIALYELQHDDRSPDFARYPAFEQMMRPTAADGRIVDGKPSGGRTFGPYLQSMPVNSMNGRHKVFVVSGGVQPGQKIDSADAGFVYSKGAKRLFATDATGRVLDDAKLSAVHLSATGAETPLSTVQTIRSQIALYRLQHEDKLPDLARYPKFEQLTSRTRTDGTVDPAGKYGPYLPAAPVNPRNGSSDVEVVEKIPDGWFPTRRVGFVYESSTGRVWATDEKWAPVANQ